MTYKLLNLSKGNFLLEDVAFLDEDDRVIKIMENTPKSRVSPIVKESKYVIEARSGEFQTKNLEVGDLVEITQVE